jgi:hypothetical protein
MLAFSAVAMDAVAMSGAAVGQGGQSVVVAVVITPQTATLAGNATQQFSASVLGLNSPSQIVAWATTAGSVDANGSFVAPATTPNHQYVKVTATSTQDDTKSGGVIVTVIGSNPSSGKGIFQARRRGSRRVQRIS